MTFDTTFLWTTTADLNGLDFLSIPSPIGAPAPSPIAPIGPGPVIPGPVAPGPVIPGPVVPDPVVPGPVAPGPVIPGPGMPSPTPIGPVPPPQPPQPPQPIFGTVNDDVLQALPEGNILIGDAGNDVLYAGTGSDAFLFGHGSGIDVIAGFDPSDTGDLIAIQANVNNTGIQTQYDLHIVDTGFGAMVDLGAGNGVLLYGVALAQLDPTDFAVIA
jgi:Ca2+-binding RTX toxin-like protein